MRSSTCPICLSKVAADAEPCPVCGHSLRPLRRLRKITILVVGLGAFICSDGLFILLLLSRPPVGLGPFTHWKRDAFTDLFLDLRTTAFVIIGAGLLIAVGLPWWLHRRAVAQGVKADRHSA